MKRSPVDWHFPRADLAAHYLRMFLDVGAHSMVLFANRGAGKTEFMTRDMIPAANGAGLFCVYTNLWDDNSNPAASFLYAMVRAAEEAGVMAKVKASLSRLRADIDFDLELGPARLRAKPRLADSKLDREAEKAAQQTGAGGAGDSVLFSMRRVVDALHEHVGRDLLFIFDEVQTLALKPEHETFVRSLRTLLDERRSHIKSIFTGSSQSRLTEMFRRIRAPLYNFAQQTEFPELGDAFLRHWMSNIGKIMGSAVLAAPGDGRRASAAQADASVLSLEGMRTGFDITKRNPRVFWSAVLSMIQTNSVDIVAASRVAAESVEEHAGLRQRLAELTPFDRLVLQEIVRDTLSRRENPSQPVEPLRLFSAPARQRLSAELGVTPTPAQVQGALRRLSSTEMQLVVSKERGHYEVEDPFFLDWLHEELNARDGAGEAAGPAGEPPDSDLPGLGEASERFARMR